MPQTSPRSDISFHSLIEICSQSLISYMSKYESGRIFNTIQKVQNVNVTLACTRKLEVSCQTSEQSWKIACDLTFVHYYRELKSDLMVRRLSSPRGTSREWRHFAMIPKNIISDFIMHQRRSFVSHLVRVAQDRAVLNSQFIRDGSMIRL